MISHNFYDLHATLASGEKISFEQFRGKVILIVNTGINCVFTPQFKELQFLHEKYHESGLVILGFPCGQFPKEKLSSDKEIGEFCQKQYGVSFDLCVKSDVNGEKTNETFKFLKSAKPGLFGMQGIKWNFTKFLVDKNGKVVERYAPNVQPKKIEVKIQTLLAN